jgi:hypothetical protein
VKLLRVDIAGKVAAPRVKVVQLPLIAIPRLNYTVPSLKDELSETQDRDSSPPELLRFSIRPIDDRYVSDRIYQRIIEEAHRIHRDPWSIPDRKGPRTCSDENRKRWMMAFVRIRLRDTLIQAMN